MNKERICTAGMREDGSWVRMYPVPFRRLEEVQQYKKFDWLECRLERNKSDPRPENKSSELQILDWEVGALYWNCLRSEDGNERRALEKVRAKYLDEFLTKDLHFFLGTTQEFHFTAPNPWVIIGVLPIPKQSQLGLFA